jgi:hypothetical protein
LTERRASGEFPSLAEGRERESIPAERSEDILICDDIKENDMIIWRGWGILALVIPLALGFLAEEACKALLGGEAPNRYFQLGAGAGLLVVWFLGRWLNGRPQKILIDPESGERGVLKGGNSLFWIPMQYWALIGLGTMVLGWLGVIGK